MSYFFKYECELERTTALLLVMIPSSFECQLPSYQPGVGRWSDDIIRENLATLEIM